MSKGTRTCKVCGKKYEYCKTYRPTGTFRWQDVACSPEHGSIYFERITESRAKKASEQSETDQIAIDPKKAIKGSIASIEPEVIESTVISNEGSAIFVPGEDTEFDDWFDDDEENEDEDDWLDEEDWLDIDVDDEWDEEDAFISGNDWPDES